MFMLALMLALFMPFATVMFRRRTTIASTLVFPHDLIRGIVQCLQHVNKFEVDTGKSKAFNYNLESVCMLAYNVVTEKKKIRPKLVFSPSQSKHPGGVLTIFVLKVLF